jgi:hypothetical protein
MTYFHYGLYSCPGSHASDRPLRIDATEKGQGEKIPGKQNLRDSWKKAA